MKNTFEQIGYCIKNKSPTCECGECVDININNYKIMNKDQLKIKFAVEKRTVSLWKIIKKEDHYVRFTGSIHSSIKRKDDSGKWDNVYSNVSCIVFKQNVEKLLSKFEEKRNIIISGYLELLPEKRIVKSETGVEYKEQIFSNPNLVITDFEFDERRTEDYKVAEKVNANAINDDIPF